MADDENTIVERQREMLAAVEGKSLFAKLGTFTRLSGPGWLQSAITLGGGSLAGALFLGALGGTSMLWLQLVAIVLGVIMLSAISYVTLSTGRRPFEAINTEINPALGWGWLIATSLANMIWCMPQFSLAYDALDRNLFAISSDSGAGLGDSANTKLIVTAIIFLAAGAIVLLNVKQGRTAKLFDIVLKAMIGMIVICFFGVVILLAVKGELNFAEIVSGLIPNLDQWSQPTGKLQGLITELPPNAQQYWSEQLVENQQSVMIAAAATAVGINMTFLLPYSMLSRGWTKQFRGLARFDLSTGMAIPYVLVTSCVVIASAASFHSRIDEKLKSTDPAIMQESPLFASVAPALQARVELDMPASESPESDAEGDGKLDDEMLAKIAALPTADKEIAASLVKRDAFQLSTTLAPLLGSTLSKLVFGLGVFGMGFSTIIILMLINGYVFREMLNAPNSTAPFVVGCAVAGLSGASWVYLWSGGAKFWLPIIASSFGMMLLPIAYITFFLMMNSRKILGDEKPKGLSMLVWNVLMLIAVAGATIAAKAAIEKEMQKSDLAYWTILGILVVYGAWIALGFLLRTKKGPAV